MMRLCLYTAGEIAAAVIIGVVLIITGLSVILVIIVITLKFRNDRHQRVTQGLKSELR